MGDAASCRVGSQIRHPQPRQWTRGAVERRLRGRRGPCSNQGFCRGGLRGYRLRSAVDITRPGRHCPLPQLVRHQPILLRPNAVGLHQRGVLRRVANVRAARPQRLRRAQSGNESGGVLPGGVGHGGQFRGLGIVVRRLDSGALRCQLRGRALLAHRLFHRSSKRDERSVRGVATQCRFCLPHRRRLPQPILPDSEHAAMAGTGAIEWCWRSGSSPAIAGDANDR